LVVVEIPEYSTGNKKLQGKTYWNISAGVRKREVERREMVEGAIFRNLDKIYAIMDEYGIPHTEPIFVDRLDGYKRHKK
jgi:mxaJ protein